MKSVSAWRSTIGGKGLRRVLERETWQSGLTVAGLDSSQRLLAALEDRSGEQYRTLRKGKDMFQAELLLFQVAVDAFTLVKVSDQTSQSAVYWVSPPSTMLPIKALNRFLSFESRQRHVDITAYIHFFVTVSRYAASRTFIRSDCLCGTELIGS